MFSHSTNTGSFLSVSFAVLIYSLLLGGVCSDGAGQRRSGDRCASEQQYGRLQHRHRTRRAPMTTPRAMPTPPSEPMRSVVTPRATAISPAESMRSSSNTTGDLNTAIGFGANVSAGDLTNATATGNGAIVNASNKIRLGNAAVTVIEGEVGFTNLSDKTKKENFQPVDGEEVLEKIRGFELSSWNFIGHDPKGFRHYGPMAQDFFVAFGHDGLGQIGSETTINSGDLVRGFL